MKAIHRRCGVAAVNRIVGHIVDNDGFACVSHLTANRGFDAQFASRLQPEIDAIEEFAVNPFVLGHAGDGDEANSCCFGYDWRQWLRVEHRCIVPAKLPEPSPTAGDKDPALAPSAIFGSRFTRRVLLRRHLLRAMDLAM